MRERDLQEELAPRLRKLVLVIIMPRRDISKLMVRRISRRRRRRIRSGSSGGCSSGGNKLRVQETRRR